MAKKSSRLKLAFNLCLLLSIVLLMVCPLTIAASGSPEDSITGSFTVPLKITNLTVTNITENSAKITWNTNGSARSQVFYDTSIHSNYIDYSKKTQIYNTPTSDHVIILTGLTASTAYHYRAAAVAMVGSQFNALSEDQTFTTLSPANNTEEVIYVPPDTTQPTGINIPIGEGTAIAVDTGGNSLTITGGVITVAENSQASGMSVYIPVELEEGSRLQSFTDTQGTTFANNMLVIPTGSKTADNTGLYFTIQDKNGDLDTVVTIHTGEVVGIGAKAMAPVESVEGAHSAYAMEDFTPVDPEVGRVGSSIDVQINELPTKSIIHIDTALQADQNSSSAFELIADSIGMTNFETAYVINVTRIGIENGKNIKSATITMKVNTGWVESHGGSDAIKILRYEPDSGQQEVLQTTFAGVDADGLAIFKGYSPNGLSVFALIGKEAQEVDIASGSTDGKPVTPVPPDEIIVPLTPEPTQDPGIIEPLPTVEPTKDPGIIEPVTPEPTQVPGIIGPTLPPDYNPPPDIPAEQEISPRNIWPIMFPSIAVCLLIVLMVLILAGKKQEFEVVFVTPPQTIKTGKTSSTISVQLRDKKGKAHKIKEDMNIKLATTSTSGRFSVGNGETFDKSHTLTVKKGTNEITFYYKDDSPGTATLKAVMVPVDKPEEKAKKNFIAYQEATVYVATVSQLAFATKAQMLTAGQPSGVIIVQTQDIYGKPIEVGKDVIINLRSTSLTGRFDITDNGKFDGSLTSIIIKAGTNHTRFYYKDMTAGTVTIFAIGASGQSWAGASQQQTIMPGAIVKVEFITSPRATTAGAVSRVIFVQTKDAYGNPANVSKNVVIKLKAASPTGKFDTSAGGAFDGKINAVGITGGSNAACFYYRDIKVGEQNIEAEAPGQDWEKASQKQIILPAD